MQIVIICLIVGFLLSWAVGWFSIPRIILVAKQRRIFDRPDVRKVHTAPVPRLGGITFLPGVMIPYCFVRGVAWSLFGAGVLNVTFLDNMMLFLSGVVVIYAIGAWDDVVGISYKRKFLFQILATLVLVLPVCYIDNLHGLFGIYVLPAWLAIPFTALIILLTVNAFNLIDGVDGLSSGLALWAFLVLGGCFLWAGNAELALFCACCVGVVSAFFYYNVFGRRFKIFMGDCGSLTLGYIVSFLLLQLISRCSPMMFPERITVITLLGIVFVPVFDTLRIFVVRIWAGHSPFKPDKGHIHHKFLALGYSHKRCMLTILAIQACYTAMNFLLAGWLNINLILLLDIVTALGGAAWLDRRIKAKRIGESH